MLGWPIRRTGIRGLGEGDNTSLFGVISSPSQGHHDEMSVVNGFS